MYFPSLRFTHACATRDYDVAYKLVTFEHYDRPPNPKTLLRILYVYAAFDERILAMILEQCADARVVTVDSFCNTSYLKHIRIMAKKYDLEVQFDWIYMSSLYLDIGHGDDKLTMNEMLETINKSIKTLPSMRYFTNTWPSNFLTPKLEVEHLEMFRTTVSPRNFRRFLRSNVMNLTSDTLYHYLSTTDLLKPSAATNYANYYYVKSVSEELKTYIQDHLEKLPWKTAVQYAIKYDCPERIPDLPEHSDHPSFQIDLFCNVLHGAAKRGDMRWVTELYKLKDSNCVCRLLKIVATFDDSTYFDHLVTLWEQAEHQFVFDVVAVDTIRRVRAKCHDISAMREMLSNDAEMMWRCFPRQAMHVLLTYPNFERARYSTFNIVRDRCSYLWLDHIRNLWCRSGRFEVTEITQERETVHEVLIDVHPAFRDVSQVVEHYLSFPCTS